MFVPKLDYKHPLVVLAEGALVGGFVAGWAHAGLLTMLLAMLAGVALAMSSLGLLQRRVWRRVKPSTIAGLLGTLALPSAFVGAWLGSLVS